MRQVGRIYPQRVNHRHGSSAHVFQSLAGLLKLKT